MPTPSKSLPEDFSAAGQMLSPLRVGAVNYLNSKPLIYGFETQNETARLHCDLPSRLADALSDDELDVALIPTFELLRDPTYQIVSDACVAADGPVASVKLYFRVAPPQVTSLALDEGSRTSAALSRVLLWRRYGIRPERTRLPIGAGSEASASDAVLLIGDRAMHEPHESFVEVWDLGQEWRRDTGLPFVFACWAARAGVDTTTIEPLLARCRDQGVAHLAAIAAQEAPLLGLQHADAERYLRENLRYTLGDHERAGLDLFQTACHEAGLLDRKTTENREPPR